MLNSNLIIRSTRLDTSSNYKDLLSIEIDNYYNRNSAETSDSTLKTIMIELYIIYLLVWENL